jgi:single-strand DNA-binding protein
MSRSVNSLTIIGNVGADPEIRASLNGTKVAQFSIATSRQWKDSKGEKQEKTEWHRCIAWNAGATGIADVIEKYVKKGDRLYVIGRVEYRQFEDRDKQTRYVTEVNVRELLMLGDGRKPANAAPGDAALAGSSAAGEGEDDLPF